MSHKTSLQPIVESFLAVGIVLAAVLTSIWGYLTYIMITEGAPIIIYILMSILIAVGFSLLGTLVYALIKAPSCVKRFEQRLFGEP